MSAKDSEDLFTLKSCHQSKPHYLVTGATGYIGSKIAEALQKNQHHVHVIVRNKRDYKRLSKKGYYTHIYFENYKSLADIFSEYSIDTVLHVAAYSSFTISPNKISELIDANLRFGLYLLSAMQEGNCQRLVNTSSYWQQDENAPSTYHPYCLYAATKQAFEVIIDHFVKNENFSAISLRLHDVYGEDDSRRKIFNLIKEAARSGTTLKVSPGEQHLRLVHIADVISAYLRAVFLLQEDNQCRHKHSCYGVGGPSASLRDLVSTYLRNSGEHASIEWGSLPYRPNQIMQPPLSNILPGWHITNDLTKTIGK